jgi:hypothetical protein
VLPNRFLLLVGALACACTSPRMMIDLPIAEPDAGRGGGDAAVDGPASATDASGGDGAPGMGLPSPDAAPGDGPPPPDAPLPPPGPDAGPPPAVCGNGTVEGAEQCDPPGTCPTVCPARGCTRFTLQGAAAQCTSRCAEAGLETECKNDDGCCPPGCNAGNDHDCAIKCDNGTREGNETCDPLSTCPTACPAQGCKLRRLVNGGTCQAECVDDKVQASCIPGDGCCPSACDNNKDSDCPVKCGNGATEKGETCDPPSQCQARSAACKSDKDTVRTGSGDPAACTFTCGEAPRLCGPADGSCPTGCNAGQDADCRLAPGAGCKSDGECLSSACIDGVCCKESCGVCESCKGPGGTCTRIARNDPDNFPAGACAGGSVCDGAGRCKVATGQACRPGVDCLTGFCASGVCCDTACTGVCRSCAVAGKVGTCSAQDGCLHISLTPSPLEFGQVTPASPLSEKNLTVTNDGTVPAFLPFDQLVTMPTGPGNAFPDEASSCLSFEPGFNPLPAGQSCFYDLVFQLDPGAPAGSTIGGTVSVTATPSAGGAPFKATVEMRAHSP